LSEALLGTNYTIAESKVFIETSCTYQEHIDMRARHLSMMKEEIMVALLEKEVQSPDEKKRTSSRLCKLYRGAKISSPCLPECPYPVGT
jgi:hypothetical protein